MDNNSSWTNSTHEEDYGHTDVVQHRIPTVNVEPIRERFRPVPPTFYKEIHSLLMYTWVCGLLKGMLEGGLSERAVVPGLLPLS